MWTHNESLLANSSGASNFTSPVPTMTSSNPNSRPSSAVDLSSSMNKIDIVWQRPEMTSSGDNKTKYLVEERRRTIIISTQLPPDQWDDSVRTQVCREISSMAEEDTYDTSSCRRTHSCADSEVATGTEYEKADFQLAPRPMRSISSSPFLSPKHAFSSNSPASPRSSPFLSPKEAVTSSVPASTRSSPFLSQNKLKKTPSPLYKNFPRKKIYFYNREDPYYGFTNFSSHPVKYEGKVYPTSEHLFQSFKVSRERRSDQITHILSSSKVIVLFWQNISDYSPTDQVWHSQKHEDSHRKYAKIGRTRI